VELLDYSAPGFSVRGRRLLEQAQSFSVRLHGWQARSLILDRDKPLKLPGWVRERLGRAEQLLDAAEEARRLAGLVGLSPLWALVLLGRRCAARAPG
jgi:hypothetical protein